MVKYMKLADGSFELILFYQKMTLTENSTSWNMSCNVECYVWSFPEIKVNVVKLSRMAPAYPPLPPPPPPNFLYVSNVSHFLHVIACKEGNIKAITAHLSWKQIIFLQLLYVKLLAGYLYFHETLQGERNFFLE